MKSIMRLLVAILVSVGLASLFPVVALAEGTSSPYGPTTSESMFGIDWVSAYPLVTGASTQPPTVYWTQYRNSTSQAPEVGTSNEVQFRARFSSSTQQKLSIGLDAVSGSGVKIRLTSEHWPSGTTIRLAVEGPQGATYQDVQADLLDAWHSYRIVLSPSVVEVFGDGYLVASSYPSPLALPRSERWNLVLNTQESGTCIDPCSLPSDRGSLKVQLRDAVQNSVRDLGVQQTAQDSVTLRSKAYELVPRLTIKGGTSAERARVRKLIKRYKISLSRGTLIQLQRRLTNGSFGLTSTSAPDVAVTYKGVRYTFSRPALVRLERGAVRSRYAAHVVAHELAHVAQWVTASSRDDYYARAGGSRGIELQADCMSQVKIGKKLTRDGASYLVRWHYSCSPSDLSMARSIWRQVR